MIIKFRLLLSICLFAPLVLSAQKNLVFAGSHFPFITNYANEQPKLSYNAGFGKEFFWKNELDPLQESNWYTFRVLVWAQYDRFSESIELSELTDATVDYERFAINLELENVLFEVPWPFLSEMTTHFGLTFTPYFSLKNTIGSEVITKNVPIRQVNPYFGLGFGTYFAKQFRVQINYRQNILSYFRHTYEETLWDVLSLEQRSLQSFSIGVAYVW